MIPVENSRSGFLHVDRFRHQGLRYEETKYVKRNVSRQPLGRAEPQEYPVELAILNNLPSMHGENNVGSQNPVKK